MTKFVALITVLAIARVAAADGYDPTELKSPDTALELSVGGTATSAALIVAGTRFDDGGLLLTGMLSALVTPSLGEWYAGKVVTPGLAIRLVSAGVVVYGTIESFRCLDECEPGVSEDRSGPAILAVGLLGFAGGALYDIATAPSAARDYNASHRVRPTIAPMVVKQPSGSVYGMSIGGNF